MQAVGQELSFQSGYTDTLALDGLGTSIGIISTITSQPQLQYPPVLKVSIAGQDVAAIDSASIDHLSFLVIPPPSELFANHVSTSRRSYISPDLLWKIRYLLFLTPYDPL